MQGGGESSGGRATGVSGLADFAADALDWAEVRALFLPFARSALGRRTLEDLCPEDDAQAREALDRLREAFAAEPGDGEPPLAGLADPRPLIARVEAEGLAMTGAELVQLAGFLRVLGATRELLLERRRERPALARLGARLPQLEGLFNELERGLDASGQPKDEASPELQRLRIELRKLHRRLADALAEVARRPAVRAALADGQGGSVHLRHGRATLAVKATQLGRVPGAVLDRSAGGDTLFVEPRELADLGNRAVELAGDEAREVSRLLVTFTRAALAHRETIAAGAAGLGRVELAYLGAAAARALDGRPALLPGEPGASDALLLRGARHPLLVAAERAGALERIVPLDLRLGDAFDQLLLTGPNTGGKTLVLKTAGAAVLLTRLGLPILAAAGSTVPLYRGIVADIGDGQEVRASLSTFAAHLGRLTAGLARAAPDVLFLLDEVGGATDPREGAALGAAVLEHLLQRRVPTLATTHLATLVEHALRHPRAENASVEFDERTLMPTYRLLIGRPGRSHGLDMARRLGLPQSVMAAAKAHLDPPDSRVQELIADLTASRGEAEARRAEAEASVAEAHAERDRLAAERAEFDARRAQLLAEVEAELESRLAACRGPLARLEALGAQLPGSQRENMEQARAALGEALAQASLTERRQAFLARLGKGDPVFLPRYGRRCPVLRVDKKRGRLAVRLGQREIEVAFEDVAAYEAL
jgi:DNA mismatch repair protein MutS2